MPRLLGLELTGTTMAIRVLIGAVLALLSFLFLVYIPLNIIEIVAVMMEQLQASSGLPLWLYWTIAALGTAVSCLTFAVVVLRGGKAYGPILMAYGVLFVAYIVASFQGGTIPLDLSLAGVAGFHDLSVRLTFDIFWMMVLYALPFALVLVKGAVVTYHDLIATRRSDA